MPAFLTPAERADDDRRDGAARLQVLAAARDRDPKHLAADARVAAKAQRASVFVEMENAALGQRCCVAPHDVPLRESEGWEQLRAMLPPGASEPVLVRKSHVTEHQRQGWKVAP